MKRRSRGRNRKILAGAACAAVIAATYSAEALTDGMQAPGPAVTDDVVALLGKRSPGVRTVGRLGKTKLAKGPAIVPRSLVASRGVSRPAPALAPAPPQTAAAAAPAVAAPETPVVMDNPALVAALNPPDFAPVFAGGGIAIPPFVGGGGGGGIVVPPVGGGGSVVAPPPTGGVTPPPTTTPPPITTPPPTGEVAPPPTVVTPPPTVVTPPPTVVTPPPGPVTPPVPEVPPLPVPESAVPEPGTWATMIIGFGAIGWAMRRRRRMSVRLQPVRVGDRA